jgi:hypothetical protein
VRGPRGWSKQVVSSRSPSEPGGGVLPDSDQKPDLLGGYFSAKAYAPSPRAIGNSSRVSGVRRIDLDFFGLFVSGGKTLSGKSRRTANRAA